MFTYHAWIPITGAAVLAILAVAAGLQPPNDLRVPPSQLGIVDERGAWRFFSKQSAPVSLDDFHETIQWTFGDIARQRRDTGDHALMAPVRMADEPVLPGSPMAAEIGNIGIFGAAAGIDVYIADDLGLADPIGSRLELLPGLRRPGHEKPTPDAFAYARWTSPRRPDDEATRAARAALECGDLARLRDAVSRRLTPQRFVDNIAHAIPYTSLRIPTDPNEARDRFCS